MEKQKTEDDNPLLIEEEENTSFDDDMIRIHTEDNNDAC
tara:strand:+ start:243 stop:359 length:117 start_codon:yes stop_codon:yes gene_type:complete